VLLCAFQKTLMMTDSNLRQRRSSAFFNRDRLVARLSSF
jgi:hypothetical protein